MKSIAFFDVDGTLMNGVSGYYTTLELIRRGYLKKRKLLYALLYKLLSIIYVGDVRKMYELATADLAGSNIHNILEIGKFVLDQFVKPRLYLEAIELIEKHRLAGDRIVLVSSGPYMTIKNLEQFLKADASYSIGPVIENNILQKNLMEPFTFMEGKVIVAEKEAKSQGVSLKKCAFYADSCHDIPLLTAVGYPGVVNPERKLRKKAEDLGWPILSFKTLLGNQGA